MNTALSRLADWTISKEPTSAARQEALNALIDTLACMLAGSIEKVSKNSREADRSLNRSNTCSTVGSSLRLSPTGAAFVNGVAAHALDYDDNELSASTHPSAVLFPSVLALSESKPSPLANVLDAYLIGLEVIVRLGKALGYGFYDAGWHATSIVGSIGAAAACSRLLNNDPEKMAAALSLGTSMSSGFKAQFGTDAKAIHAGLAAQAGVRAAVLADHGVSASSQVWSEQQGLIGLVGGRNAPGLDYMDTNDGPPATDYLVRKAFPCCGYTHRAVQSALKLHNVVDPTQIETGVIFMPAPFAKVVDNRMPNTVSVARFSTTYCVAAALFDGKLDLDSFSEQALSRNEIMSLSSRFTLDPYTVPENISDLSPEYPDQVSLRCKGGAVASQSEADIRGSKNNPIDCATLAVKFRDCARRALSPANAAKLGDFVARPLPELVNERVDRFLSLTTR